MKKLIFPFFFFLILSSGYGQTVAALADKQKILIGEQFKLKLFGEFRKGTPLSWFSIDSIPHFEILERAKADTLEKANSITIEQVLTLTSWDSGLQMVPSFRLNKSATEPVKIIVSFSPFDPNQPYHDVKNIIDVKKPAEEKWYWYFIGLLVLIALFLLFFPKGKKKDKPAFTPDEGAYKAALRKLDALKAQPSGDAKLLYTELVQIFREYLQKRRNIQSFSKTTDDLAIQIRDLDLGNIEYQGLVQTLRLSDLVKFAQFTPSETENKHSIDTVKQSIITIEQLPHVV